MAEGIAAELRTIRSVARHFLVMSLRDRAFLITSMIIPVNYLFLFLLTVINGGQAPTALVVGHDGPRVEQFVGAMSTTDSFDVRRMSPGDAAAAFQRGEVVAVLTLSSSFDADVDAGRPIALDISVNNLNADFTDDIRRGLDLTVQHFDAAVAPSRLPVQGAEVDTVGRQVDYIPYVLVSIVVVAIMIGGLFQGGVNVAREYERSTIIDIALAPTRRSSTVLGMVAGTCAVSGGGVVLITGILVGVFGIRPVHWPSLLLVGALLTALFSAAGVLLGNALRQRNGLSGLAVLLSLPMLSLSGAFFPVTWSHPVVAAVARFTPTYYANALIQYAVHDAHTTPTPLWFDTLAVIGFTVLIVAASATLFSRRELRA